MNTLITGGQVFLDNGFVKKDILISDSKISDLKTSGAEIQNTIDAENLYIFPGLIDMHVHFRDFGESKKETWSSGSKAAAAGGITTVFDMPNNKKPILTKKLLDAKRKKVSAKSLVNFGLYMAATDKNIGEINNSKVNFVKLYYGETTGRIIPGDAEKIFRELNKEILIVAHAEDNNIIEDNKKKYSSSESKYHSLIRDNKAEFTAVHDLIGLAEMYGRKLHITHVSTKESALLIRQAKLRGIKITCDTCPHYLFLDDSLYGKIGNMAKVNPALKSKKDNEMLWAFINDRTIDCICSDHAPHAKEDKCSKVYEDCPSGFPGVETTVQLMLNSVHEGKITLERFAEMMSDSPAKIFNLKGKGRLNVGYDADVTLIDMKRLSEISGKKFHSKAKWSPFEGTKTKGAAVMTIVNGNVVYNNGKSESSHYGIEVK